MRISIIGCGSMGSAFARKLTDHELLLYNRTPEKAKVLAEELKATFTTSVDEAIEKSEIVVLGMKPKSLESFAHNESAKLTDHHVIISMLSGVSLSELRQHFPKGQILRIMPNLPVSVGKGIVGVALDPSMSKELKSLAGTLFAPLGVVSWIDESLFDPFTSLAGCAPGFAFLIFEAFTEGGVRMGFNAQESLKITLQVFEGAIALLRESGELPMTLKWRVAAPGGVTILGLQKMEEYHLKTAILKGLLASIP